ncbi:MAG: hypothetical protein GC179_26505 [Anaerolineaceae bacterium]|nr:hypothetical protein [Anaerolineaceae bacterium]
MARLTDSELATIMDSIIESYDGKADDFKVFIAKDNLHRTYAVTGIPNHITVDNPSFIIVHAHIEDDYVVIDVDSLSEKYLWQRLEKAGVPREQILLAYKGEQLPESSSA